MERLLGFVLVLCYNISQAAGGKGAVGETVQSTDGPGAPAVTTGNLGGTLASFYGRSRCCRINY